MAEIDQAPEDLQEDLAPNIVDPDEDEDDEDEDDDDVKVTIEDTAPDYIRAKHRQPQQAKPAAIDLEAGQAILDVDLNTLEDKPWRKPGADISDYFNYGFDEDTWKLYCDKQRKMKSVVNELTTPEAFKIPVVPTSSVMKIPTIVSNEPRFTNWVPVAEPDERREREKPRDRQEKPRDRENKPRHRGEKERDRGEKERDRGEKERDRGEKERDRGEKERDRGEKSRDRREKPRHRGEKERDRGEKSRESSSKKRERDRSHERDSKRRKRDSK